MVCVMAADDRITLIIEGLPEDEGQVRLAAFMSQIQSLSATLTRLDRDTNNGRSATYFRIAELSYSSPIRVVIEPKSLPRHPYVGHLLIESLVRVTHAIETGERITEIDADVLDNLGALTRPVGKTVKNATLIFNDHQFDLTERVARRIEEALAVNEEADGFVEGMLDPINVHLGADTFHIYPEVGPKKVSCYFSARLYDDAISAVGRHVEISGRLRYRAGADSPIRLS